MAPVHVAASSVAALIGRHRYRSRAQALLETLDRQRSPDFAALQAQLREDPLVCAKLDCAWRTASALPCVAAQAARAPTEDAEFGRGAEVRQELAAEARRTATARDQAQLRQETLRVCAGDSHAADLEAQRLEAAAKADAAAADAAATAAATARKNSKSPRTFKAISARVKAHFAAQRLREAADQKRQLAAEVRTVGSSPERLEAFARETARLERQAAAVASLAAAEPAQVAEATARAALLRRGELREATVLDSVAAREGQAVAQRNDRLLRHEGNGFVLTGRVDGVVADGRVVEVKTRRNWFARPPDYDVVQLQVYLRLLGLPVGVLEERSQRDESLARSTEVTCDDAAWQAIIAGLEEAARELREATLETARGWAA